MLSPLALKSLLTPELLFALPAEKQQILVKRLSTDVVQLRKWVIAHPWPWPVRRLAQMQWPARRLVTACWPQRCLAEIPWASVQVAAPALQPFLATLPSDICSMIGQYCTAAK